MAVQSSTPSFPPLLKRAHIRKAISRGQMTTKTADGTHTRHALLSFGSSAGAAVSDMLARPAALVLLVLLTREASSLEKVTLSYLQGTRTRQTREGMGARYLALRLPTLAVMRPLVPKEESCSACSIHCASLSRTGIALPSPDGLWRPPYAQTAGSHDSHAKGTRARVPSSRHACEFVDESPVGRSCPLSRRCMSLGTRILDGSVLPSSLQMMDGARGLNA